MTEPLFFAVALFATLGSGVMGGLFFAFSTFIMRALGRLPPAQGVAAMNAINAAILTPLFALVFFGTPLACAALIVHGLMDGSAPGTAWLIAGGAVHIVGSFAVTLLFNVPLNNVLAATDPESADGAAVWSRYRSVWTSWNHLRTVACLAATGLLTAALWLQGPGAVA